MQEAQRAKNASERALLEAVRGNPGSEQARAAASELLMRYQDRVYAWCCRHIGDPDRAMDVAQEALLGAYRSLAKFEGRSSFAGWIFAIARHKCINEHGRRSLDLANGADPDDFSDPDDDPADALIAKQDEEALLDLIGQHLTTLEQRVLWLRCVDRQPINSITALLAIEQASGARGVLQTARRKLRAALAKEGAWS